MKVLIVSDTHGRDYNLNNIIDREKPLDMLIHLGDGEGCEYNIAKWINAGCDVNMVLGNNDFFSNLDREKEIKIGRYKALLTHGHLYGVSLGVEGLLREAKARDLDIVMYGHTHKPYCEIKEGVRILNPGSLSYPRQSTGKGTYMIMYVDSEGELKIDLKEL